MSPRQGKEVKLTNILKKMDKVLIAFSGGVDSTFLVYLANRILPGRVLAVTAVSDTYPARELKAAKVLAREIRVRHLVIRTRELENKKFRANTAERCYFCKKELFNTLLKIAAKNKIDHVVDAANIDDLKDYRPGFRASRELGIRHPLQEAGFTKRDIREMSRRYGLPTWDKPALACLASRVPYGNEINSKILARIDQAERYLLAFGLRQVRVRDHGTMARIEVDTAAFPQVLRHRKKITGYFKKLGYLFVTLDLAGYKMGSLNAELPAKTAQ